MSVRVTWILPFLDEEEVLPAALARLSTVLDRVSAWVVGDGVGQIRMEVVLLDSGSRDRSGEIAKAWIVEQSAHLDKRGRSFLEMRWVNAELTSKPEGPSLGRALVALKSSDARPKGEWIIVLPVDCMLTDFAVDLFIQRIRGFADGGGGGRSTNCRAGMFFLKAYDPTTWTLQVYAGLQNWIRLRGMRLAVWTNAITVSRRAWNEVEVPRDGFLEDVIWVDRLLQCYGRGAFEVIEGALKVSSRRYYPDRIWRRIAVNGWVMLLFRMKLLPVSELRRIYRSLS